MNYTRFKEAELPAPKYFQGTAEVVKAGGTVSLFYSNGTKWIELSNDGVIQQYTSANAPSAASVGIGNAVVVDGFVATSDGTSFSRPILKTGSGNAAANTTAIQAAINRKGDVFISGVPGTTYLINNTLTIGSDTNLIVSQGVTIKLADSTNKNVLVNEAYKRSRVNITALTYTSVSNRIVCTAVCAAAHGYAVNDYVCVAWAATKGYNGVFKVTSVTTTTVANDTFTYEPECRPDTATATVHASAPGSVLKTWLADKNIRITGGIWDYNTAGQTALPSGDMAHAFIMLGIANSKFTDMRFLNAGKFAVFSSQERNFIQENISLDTNSDGLHHSGPSFGARVRNVSGFVRDDGVIADTGDYAGSAYASSGWVDGAGGDVLDFKADGVNIYSTTAATAVYSGFNTNSYWLRGIRFNGVGGNSYRVAHLGAGNAANVIHDVTYDGVTCAVGNMAFSIDPSTTIDKLTIKDHAYASMSDSNNPAIEFSGSTAATINQLNLENITASYGGSHTGSIGYVGVRNLVTIYNINIRGMRLAHKTNAVFGALKVDSGGVVKNCIATGITWRSARRLFYINTGGTVESLTINGATAGDATAGDLVYLGGTCTNLNLENINYANGAVENIVNVFNNAGVANIRGTNIYSPIRPVLTLAAGTTGVAVFSDEIPVDVGLLPATKNQKAKHSSAVAGRNSADQQGIAICNGTNWYALATGVSGANVLIV